MNKKAQAAMEFLMTYGWAILVVLVVIGSLAYFGVLSPTALLPEKCFMPIGLSCTQHLVSATAGTAKFQFLNGLGDKITITNFLMKDANGITVCSSGPLTTEILNGQSKEVSLASCTGLGTASEKVRFTMQATYYKGSATTFEHTLDGELLARLE
ncbi:MAG: hypothetical protein WC471_02075 [Candidatus Woesearchaeota archaeon]